MTSRIRELALKIPTSRRATFSKSNDQGVWLLIAGLVGVLLIFYVAAYSTNCMARARIFSQFAPRIPPIFEFLHTLNLHDFCNRQINADLQQTRYETQRLETQTQSNLTLL
jgi:hypothetical protein